MKIGFLGYGEAARAFHEGLSRSGLSFIAYDILLDRDDEVMAEAIRSRGGTVARTIAALAEADWIFSAVTADQSLLAVEPLLPHLKQGQVFGVRDLVRRSSVGANRVVNEHDVRIGRWKDP